MADEPEVIIETPSSKTVTQGGVFMHTDYRTDLCTNGMEHLWDGPALITWCGECSTCSVCGLDFDTWGMRNLP